MRLHKRTARKSLRRQAATKEQIFALAEELDISDKWASDILEMLEKSDEDPESASYKEQDWLGVPVLFIEVGQREYVSFEDYNDAVKAVENEYQELFEEEPGQFRDHLQYYVDEERLKRDLMQDEVASIYEDASYEITRGQQLEYYAEEMDVDLDSSGLQDDDRFWDEDGELREDVVIELLMEKLDDYADDAAAERLDDPVQWLEDAFGPEEAFEFIMRNGAIDFKRAAEDAIINDGLSMLASYDGNYDEGNYGSVWIRQN